MSQRQIPKYAERLIEQIAKENGFNDYLVDLNNGKQPGDGFSSELFAIVIAEKNNNKRLDLVCKVAAFSESHREEFNSSIMFQRETLAYTKYLPIFFKFYDEKNVPKCERFLAYPKCYATLIDHHNEHFAIVLEDLRPEGYKMWNKAKPSPIANVSLVMRELGKLHGLSFALRDQKPDALLELKQMKNIYQISIRKDNVQAMFKTTFDRALKSLKNESHKKIVEDLKLDFASYLEDCFNSTALERYGILCHGDCWNNNILYRFNENGVAENIRFLDWQMVQYSSPAIDLLYNIFSSTDKAFRDKEYENMLKCYYDSLSKTIKLLGSDSDKLFTYENLKDELKRCGNYPLVLASMLLGVSLADSSEVSNLDEMFDDDGKEKQMDLITGLSGKGQQEFDRRINEIFEDVIRLGYYHKIN